jgi:hypothetical protein
MARCNHDYTSTPGKTYDVASGFLWGMPELGSGK